MPKRSLKLLSSAVALTVAGCAGGSRDEGPPAPTSSRSTTTASTGVATDDDAAPVVRVVVAGDIACVPGQPPSPLECQQEATARLVEQLDPAVVLAVGDLQYERGESANFDGSYNASWGRFKDKTRPAPGNHEYAGGRAAGYFGYFGAAAHPPGGWYSFEVPEAGWHIVMLNSVCTVVGCAPDSEQVRWLDSDLRSANGACTLAAWHHPRWTSGLHGEDASTDPLWAALVRAHADVVVSGHDHHYERIAPRDGVRQFIAGTGGRSLYPVIVRTAGSEFVDTTHFGVLELELRSTSYTWRFHSIDGGVLDEGTTDCT